MATFLRRKNPLKAHHGWIPLCTLLQKISLCHGWLDEEIFRRNPSFHIGWVMNSIQLTREEVLWVKSVPSREERIPGSKMVEIAFRPLVKKKKLSQNSSIIFLHFFLLCFPNNIFTYEMEKENFFHPNMCATVRWCQTCPKYNG